MKRVSGAGSIGGCCCHLYGKYIRVGICIGVGDSDVVEKKKRYM